MVLQALSLGREVDVWKPRVGAVHSVFERAVNLLLDGELWTVIGAERPDAPFGIRVPRRDGGFEVKPGDRVHVRAGFVRIDKMILDCRTAPRWAPARWGGLTSGLATRLAFVKYAARPRAWVGAVDMARDVVEGLAGSDEELARAVARTVGRGPGLTPSGDDLIVGMLAVLTSGCAELVGLRAASRLVSALMPVTATTTDVSRHLLQQAMRGLFGRALHELGQALIEGAPDGVLEGALVVALDTGCTSGADACMGLAASFEFIFLNTQRIAA